MSRYKDFDATGVPPSGRLFAGDLNGIQDHYADIVNLTQSVSVGSLAVGEAGLILSRFGAGEARISGALRADGILRGLGGFLPGTFTTAQRDAIPAGFAPFGIQIINVTTNRYEWNSGTDAARVWKPLNAGVVANTDLPARLQALSTDVPGDNCNNATDNGWYYASPTTVNSPSSSTWWAIFVVNTVASTHVRQIAYDYQSDAVWMRRQTASVWGAWVQIGPPGAVTSANLPTRIQSAASNVPGDNCNGATDNGWYYASPSAANTPSSSTWWAIFVVNVTANIHTRQIAYDYQSDAVWMRRQTSSVWGAWVQIWPLPVIQTITNRTLASGPPPSPVDGDIWNALDVGSGAGSWQFVYRASEPTYKWHFIGGAGLISEVNTLEPIDNTAYVALATAGPSITIPRAGDYDVEIHGHYGGIGYMSYNVGAAAASDTNALHTGSSAALGASSMSLRRQTGLAASTALVAMYRNDTGQGGFYWSNRRMRVTPVRII